MARRSVALGVGWFLMAALALGAQVAAAIDVGDVAPNFTLRDLDGTNHTLTSYRSHPVLLMFLESDASASIALAPRIESEIYEVYSGQDLMVLGLDCRNGTLTELDNFRNQTGVEFPLLQNASSTQGSFGVANDSFVLVDGGGIVRYVSEGPGIDSYNASEMRAAIERLLQDANNTKTATWGEIKSLYID